MMQKLSSRRNTIAVNPGLRLVVFGLAALFVFAAAAGWLRQPERAAASSLAAIPSETQAMVRVTPTPPVNTPTITPTVTRTPIPAYMLDVAHSTDGVIIGTLLLVIIVLVGTIAGITIRRKQHPS